MTRAQVLTTLVLPVGLAGAGVAAAALLPAVSQQLNGQPAADFQANTVDGRVLTLDDFRGQALGSVLIGGVGATVLTTMGTLFLRGSR